ncbi:MAG: hypothetical protein ACH350_07160 [Parachlamydiaceae bacterium]
MQSSRHCILSALLYLSVCLLSTLLLNLDAFEPEENALASHHDRPLFVSISPSSDEGYYACPRCRRAEPKGPRKRPCDPLPAEHSVYITLS